MKENKLATTLKQIAKKVGVHPSTISRVLSGKYDNFNVSKETRDLIMATAEQMQYVPNEMARGLRLKRTHTIGLVIPDILNPLYAGIVRSVENASSDEKYQFVICNTDEQQDKEIKLVEMLISKGMDGMLIVPVQKKIEHIAELKKQNYPFVLMMRCFSELDTHAVVMDNCQDAFMAVEHLLKLGHRRIGFISGRRISYEIQGRELGYRSALTAYGAAVDPDLILGDGCTTKDGFLAARELLNRPGRPSALLVSENVIIVGVLQAISEAGLMIPDDISVVSFADMTFAPYFSTPLTTVSMPIEQIGAQAIQLLLKQINSPGQHPYEKISLSGNFILRDSTHKPLGS